MLHLNCSYSIFFFDELKRIAIWLVKYYSDKFDNWGSELVYLYPWTLWLPEWVLYNVLLDLSVCPSGEFSSFSEFTFCRLLPSFPPLTKELTAWHCMTFHVVPQWRRWQMINIFMLSVVLSLTRVKVLILLIWLPVIDLESIGEKTIII